MTLVMYDSALNSMFAPGADAYAAYVDGGIGDQPNYGYIVTAFPQARHLSIALYASHDADALDIERGAAAPADFPAWHARQQARGVARPCAYASVSTMAAQVLPLVAAYRPQVRLWTAHYGQGEHICGPKSCGLLPVDADGTQWTSAALGRSLDQSLLRDDFFGGAITVTDIPLDIRGSYTDGSGHLYVVGVRRDGVLCESKRTAIGVWTDPYPIAGKTGT